MKSRLRIAVGFSKYHISFFTLCTQIHSFLTRGSAEQGCGRTEATVKKHELRLILMYFSPAKDP